MVVPEISTSNKQSLQIHYINVKILARTKQTLHFDTAVPRQYCQSGKLKLTRSTQPYDGTRGVSMGTWPPTHGPTSRWGSPILGTTRGCDVGTNMVWMSSLRSTVTDRLVAEVPWSRDSRLFHNQLREAARSFTPLFPHLPWSGGLCVKAFPLQQKKTVKCVSEFAH